MFNQSIAKWVFDITAIMRLYSFNTSQNTNEPLFLRRSVGDEHVANVQFFFRDFVVYLFWFPIVMHISRISRENEKWICETFLARNSTREIARKIDQFLADFAPNLAKIEAISRQNYPNWLESAISKLSYNFCNFHWKDIICTIFKMLWMMFSKVQKIVRLSEMCMK